MSGTEGRVVLANIMRAKLSACPHLVRVLALDEAAGVEFASIVTELMVESSDAALESVKSSIDMMRGSVFATARWVR